MRFGTPTPPEAHNASNAFEQSKPIPERTEEAIDDQSKKTETPPPDLNNLSAKQEQEDQNTINQIRQQLGLENKDLLIEQENLNKLYSSLDNHILTNSEGTNVTLHVQREKTTNTKEEIWHVTFQYEYRGKLINHKYSSDNYIQLDIEPEKHTITIGMARLESLSLRGKNIYPQVIKLLNDNFPDNYELNAEFGHDKTKQDILKIKDKYHKELIDIDQFKQEVLQTYLFKTRIAGGFNYFELTFTPDSKGEVFLNVKSKKVEERDRPKLVISGL